MKLHLGCGHRNFGDDWIHIDQIRAPHIHSHNILDLPFGDDECDLIYASHVLEYFDREEAKDVLGEWHRVLKPGGTLRLAVPDFEMIALLYFTKEFPLSSFLGPIYGKISPDNKDPIYHKTGYDFESLKKLLEDCWFTNVRRWDWRKVDHGKYDDQSQAYLPKMDKENGRLISLNVEATAT